MKITKTLQLDEEKARRLYPTASAELKEMLTDTFGKEFFSVKITDRIKTLDDVCAHLGIDGFTEPDTDDADEIASYWYSVARKICRILNEGWKPDWNNSDQCKWYPVFDMRSGFGFSYAGYAGSFAYTYVGSRFCCKDDETACHLGTHFEEVFKKILTK